MTQLFPVAGCSFFISSAAIDAQSDDFEASDFDSVTWVQIKGWASMGAIGDTASLVTSDQIDVQRTRKSKGVRNAGSMANTFDVIATDTGQLALIAAEKTSLNYGFKVELNDAPSSGSAPTPSERLFVGLVMSASEQGGGANSPRQLNSTIEVNSNIVAVAAATGD